MANEPRPATSNQATGSPPSESATTDRAREEARHVAETGRHGASQVAGEAQSQAVDLARTARDEARHRVDDEVGKLAGFIGDMGEQLDGMADNAERTDGYLPALARDGAEFANRLSRRLDSGGVEAVLEDVTTFARRRPAMFLAAAFGVGLVLGRVTRNTDVHSISDQMGDDDDARSSDEPAQPSATPAGARPAAVPAATASGPAPIGRMR